MERRKSATRAEQGNDLLTVMLFLDMRPFFAVKELKRLPTLLGHFLPISL